MTTPTQLFTPFQWGTLSLAHRVVMPPLTRMRADAVAHTPSALAATYYSQRATAGGLLIAEATQISPQGQGYPQTPGIHTDTQVAAWRQVTQAVKARGATFFLQLWHVGRVSHTSFQPGGALPVAPSALAPAGETMTNSWQRAPYEVPRALETGEIAGLIDDYRRAALRAREAGFDGVEIHAANGYLIDQFLQDHTNHRQDAYGGPVAHRMRLLLEVVDAVAQVWPLERIGVRVSPFGENGDIGDSDPCGLFLQVAGALAARGIGYLHVIEPRSRAGLKDGVNDAAPPSMAAVLRTAFPGPLIASGGFTAESAEQALRDGSADLIAFGRAFIANPDLPQRLAAGAPLNGHHRPTFYGGDARGYTDYPTLDAAVPAR
jgi:N-ethylmaleimide reductase